MRTQCHAVLAVCMAPSLAMAMGRPATARFPVVDRPELTISFLGEHLGA